MVKFVGGFSASTNAYKSYKNHTIAREGQWRMPRAYGSVKKEVKINIRKYNYGGNYANYGGFQLPSWLQWAQFGMNWINQLIPQREYTPATVQPQDNNPFAKELEDLKKEIEELKAENKKLKNKPAETDPEVEEPETEKPKDSSEISFTKDVTEGQEAKEGETLTTPAMVKFGKKLADGRVQFQGWQTLADSYGVQNTAEFRNWFRQNHLKGLDKDIWQPGVVQNFPTEINYPEGSDKKYSFDPDKFANAHDYHTPNGKSKVRVGNLAERKGPGTPATEGKTTYTGTVKATVGGKTYSSSAKSEVADENTAHSKIKAAMIQDLISQGLDKKQAEAVVANAKIK